MRVLRDHEGTLGPGPRVVAVGVFDGLHRGHQALLRSCLTLADGAATAVVTFDPHPAVVLAPDRAPSQLATLEQRLEGLEVLGVDAVRVVTFSDELARESAESFVERVLLAECAASIVVVGEDFRFGHDRQGDVSLLRTMGERHGFVVAPLAIVGDSHRWSSTTVRAALVALVAGLLVAIPALMFYNYFSKAISNMALELESQAFQAYRDLRQQIPATQK